MISGLLSWSSRKRWDSLRPLKKIIGMLRRAKNIVGFKKFENSIILTLVLYVLGSV